MSDLARGLFVTLEGGEGAGKSTLARMLSDRLTAENIPHLVTREPGTGRVGAGIRSILLDGEDDDLDPYAEALLFAADRAQNVATVIRPALERGELVLCDRHVDSSVAYQGYARGLGAAGVRNVSVWGTRGLQPDLTIVIDVDPRDGLNRKHVQRETNRMEQLDVSFHEQVREAFRTIAAGEPARVRLLDGARPLNLIADEVWGIVLAAWRGRGAAES